MRITVYYDGACPFCADYTAYMQLRSLTDHLELVNLRDDVEALLALEARGLDLDQGMVVEVDGHFHDSADAMRQLALLTNNRRRWRWASRIMQRSPGRIGRGVYSLLRAGRNSVLFFLGRERIRPDSSVVGRLNVFALVLGVFALLHVLVYATQFAKDIYATTWLIALLGGLLVFRSGDRRVLVLLLLAFAIDGWRQMPVFSNHTIIKDFLVWSALLGGLWCWLAGRNAAAWYQSFAPVGRSLLILMYFFGVFHKINSGFLDVDVSCAITLWREMPWPLRLVDFTAFRYLAIYGVLVIEAAIVVMLLVARWRHAGIAAGMLFHSMLALSGYALYATFSMLSIALHSLFLSEPGARGVMQQIQILLWGRKWIVLRLAMIVGGGGVIVWSAVLGNYSEVGLVWFILMLPFIWVVIRHGGDGSKESPRLGVLLARPVWMNILVALFFLNCITPYLGLKTVQSGNMFANLRLEAGVSNHYLLPWAPGPFGYLEDLVEIRDGGAIRYLKYVEDEGLALTYYSLLDHLSRSPRVKVSFVRNGQLYEGVYFADLQEDADEILHPFWVRRWFHFAPVDLTEPKPCALDR